MLLLSRRRPTDATVSSSARTCRLCRTGACAPIGPAQLIPTRSSEFFIFRLPLPPPPPKAPSRYFVQRQQPKAKPPRPRPPRAPPLWPPAWAFNSKWPPPPSCCAVAQAVDNRKRKDKDTGKGQGLASWACKRCSAGTTGAALAMKLTGIITTLKDALEEERSKAKTKNPPRESQPFCSGDFTRQVYGARMPRVYTPEACRAAGGVMQGL